MRQYAQINESRNFIIQTNSRNYINYFFKFDFLTHCSYDDLVG